MKASEINDCEICPLNNTDYCRGVVSSPGGMPIEPPCTSWNPDDEIDIGDYEADRIAMEEYYYRIYKAEQEAKMQK